MITISLTLKQLPPKSCASQNLTSTWVNLTLFTFQPTWFSTIASLQQTTQSNSEVSASTKTLKLTSFIKKDSKNLNLNLTVVLNQAR